MAKNNETDLQSINIIASSTKNKGDIETKTKIRIDGTLEGNLKTSGRLVVGSKGLITGDILCKSADIEGAVVGAVDVEELISLKQTSNLQGEISTTRIVIESGAMFSGNCKMKNISSGKSK